MKKEFNSNTLSILDKFLSETPKEEIENLLSKYQNMDIEGPSVDEYMCIIQQEFSNLDVEDYESGAYSIPGNLDSKYYSPPNTLIKTKKKTQKNASESFFYLNL